MLYASLAGGPAALVNDVFTLVLQPFQPVPDALFPVCWIIVTEKFCKIQMRSQWHTAMLRRVPAGKTCQLPVPMQVFLSLFFRLPNGAERRTDEDPFRCFRIPFHFFILSGIILPVLCLSAFTAFIRIMIIHCEFERGRLCNRPFTHTVFQGCF